MMNARAPAPSCRNWAAYSAKPGGILPIFQEGVTPEGADLENFEAGRASLNGCASLARPSPPKLPPWAARLRRHWDHQYPQGNSSGGRSVAAAGAESRRPDRDQSRPSNAQVSAGHQVSSGYQVSPGPRIPSPAGNPLLLPRPHHARRRNQWPTIPPSRGKASIPSSCCCRCCCNRLDREADRYRAGLDRLLTGQNRRRVMQRRRSSRPISSRCCCRC